MPETKKTSTVKFPLEKFEKIRTPFYYYDLSLLSDTLSSIKEATADLPNYHVHYAIKANANPRLLRQIASAGFGADCVSGGEIETALSSGFDASKIVFAGVGKSDWEINLGLDNNIACFNVESIPELEVINQLAAKKEKTANVAFRVNPNIDAHTHEKITTGLNENKFGIAMEDLHEAIGLACKMKNINYVGLHFHIGSQILDLDAYHALCQRVNDLQKQLESAGIKTQTINVGGGLGIDYEQPDANPIPDFQSYFGIFRKHLNLRSHQQLHVELGRSVVAQCGSLIARTLYIKKGHTKQFLIVDAGLTELIRPAMYGAVHATLNISAPKETPTEVYDVVGPICESSDVFAKAMPLPQSRRGDFIAFRSAGAYGETMASCYNCRQLPQSYFNMSNENLSPNDMDCSM